MPIPPMELGAYFDIVWRRKWHIVIPLVLIMAIASFVAVVLPPVYVSEATILIEQPEIPVDYVESTVTGFVQERVEGISKRIMSRERLIEIIDKFDLYGELREQVSMTEVAREMRQAIGLRFENVRTGRSNVSVALAFVVSFAYVDPEVARLVADELTKLYLEENRRGRAEQAAQVLGFLDQEAKRLLARLSELDGQIAEFKQDNRSDLPELSSMNLQLLQQTSSQIERSEERLRDLHQRRESIQAELSVTPRQATDLAVGAIMSPSEHLNVLRAQYLQKSTTYSSNHPDLIKLRRQISVLEKQAANPVGVSGLSPELDQLRAELSDARSRYSEDHPDVRKLRRAIEALEQRITTDSNFVAGGAQRIDANPRYVMLQTSLRAVNEDIIAQNASHSELVEKQAEYERRLVRAPLVQRDQTALTRDYDNAQKKYREIRDKQLEAELAQQLELDEKSERFTLVSRPFVPESPESPNRLGIVLLGTVIGMGGGLGTAAIGEYLDRTIRGARGLVALLGAPPLASIPFLLTAEEIRARSKRRWMIGALVVVCVAAALTAVHFLVIPMDELIALVFGTDDGTSPGS